VTAPNANGRGAALTRVLDLLTRQLAKGANDAPHQIGAPGLSVVIHHDR
jgi:hypothetical protein